jgi:tetratricopeptide (TPR) repeat protein
LRLLLLPLVALAALAAGRAYDVSGEIAPPAVASVTLFGATSPFNKSVIADADGRFHFSRIEEGTYTVAVYLPGRGEMRTTIEVGPKTADDKGRVNATIHVDEAKLEPDQNTVVSVTQLSVPNKARDEYREAVKRLSKRDVPGAILRFKRAIEIAPQFSAAWNNLGTIAYQTHDFAAAEQDFRKALASNPASFEALVNLGGVLVTLNKLDEAWKYNVDAVVARPNDALANSQLGMVYFGLGDRKLAEKYLLIAERIDPTHFSHPQLLLAEIYLRERRNAQAADQLQNFLDHHPDWPQAAGMRTAIAKLRQ